MLFNASSLWLASGSSCVVSPALKLHSTSEAQNEVSKGASQFRWAGCLCAASTVSQEMRKSLLNKYLVFLDNWLFKYHKNSILASVNELHSYSTQ